MPRPSTASEPMFCPSSINPSQMLLICTLLTDRDCTPCEGRGRPPPSTGMGKKEEGLSSKVSVWGRTSSPSTKHVGRRQRCGSLAQAVQDRHHPLPQNLNFWQVLSSCAAEIAARIRVRVRSQCKGVHRCRPYRVDIWRNHRHRHMLDI